MIDKNNIWIVPENDQEITLLNELIGNPKEYSKIQINYKRLKQLLKLDYIQIGIYNKVYEEILGYLKISDYKFLVKDFEPIKTLQNKYFKVFFKYLTKNIKLYTNSIITFYYNKNKRLVVVVVGDKFGAIACYEEKL